MAHKPPPPPEEEKGESAPLWIISFADLVTLMLSFFVILSANSGGGAAKATDSQDLTDLAAAIRTAFKYLPPADSHDPIDMKILLNSLKNQRGRGGVGSKGEADRPIDGAAGLDDRVTTIRTGTQNTMGGVIPFEKDSAELKPEAMAPLTQILAAMRGHTNIFVVKGHTSRDEEYRLRGSSRDLSYERANAVVAKLVSSGVARETLRAQSCRDYEPRIERAYGESTHAANRRCEVIATEELVSELRGEPKEISPETGAAPAAQPVH